MWGSADDRRHVRNEAHRPILSPFVNNPGQSPPPTTPTGLLIPLTFVYIISMDMSFARNPFIMVKKSPGFRSQMSHWIY